MAGVKMNKELEHLFQESKATTDILTFTLPKKQKEQIEILENDNGNTNEKRDSKKTLVFTNIEGDEQDAKLSRREKAKLKQDPQEKLDRTLFIGNVPSACLVDSNARNDLLKLFSKFGTVESMRFRSLTTQAHISKKIAYKTKQVDLDHDSMHVYIVMADVTLIDDIIGKLNMVLFMNHHLRVDRASPPLNGNSDLQRKWDTKKSIFIGNLPLKIKDEQVYNHFSSCGTITNIRIIKDSHSGLSKGFAFVTFANKSSLELALQLDGITLEKRPLRIKKCAKADYLKNKKKNTEVWFKNRSNSSKIKNPDNRKSFSNKFDESKKKLPKRNMKVRIIKRRTYK